MRSSGKLEFSYLKKRMDGSDMKAEHEAITGKMTLSMHLPYRRNPTFSRTVRESKSAAL